MSNLNRLSILKHDLRRDLRSIKFIFDSFLNPDSEKIDYKMGADAQLILSQIKLNWDEYLEIIKINNIEGR